MIDITVEVAGRPVPQGSLRVGRNGRQYWSNNAKLRPYRKRIADAIERATGNVEPQQVPVIVDVTFVFARPKTHVKSNGELRADAPEYRLIAPDTDKLARAVLDAITDADCVWTDDACCVELRARKRFATDELTEGTYLNIVEVSTDDVARSTFTAEVA